MGSRLLKPQFPSSQRVLVLGIDRIAEKNLRQFRSMASLGWSYSVIALDTESDTSLCRNTQVGLLEVDDLSRGRCLFIVNVARKLMQRWHHIEVYAASPVGMVLVLLARLFRHQIIVVERGDIDQIEDLPIATRVSLKLAYRIASGVWFKEPYMEPALRSYRARRTYFVPNPGVGVSPEPDSDRRISFVWANRLLPSRLPDVFVEAVGSLIDCQPRSALLGFRSSENLSLGEVMMETKCAALAPEWLECRGWQDPADTFRDSRFFVMLGERIFGNNSLLEAMSFGVVPIVSDSPDIDRLIRDGVNGLITGNDVHSVQATLRRAIEMSDEEWAALSSAATKTIGERFSPEAFSEELSDLYRRMETHPRPASKSRSSEPLES